MQFNKFASKRLIFLQNANYVSFILITFIHLLHGIIANILG